MTNSATIITSQLAWTIREKQLFRIDDTLVVAASGGADSTALLDLLSRLPDYNLKLVAAHLNHSLRGSESDGDEAFCRSLAEKYGIPFETRRVDIKVLAKAGGLNLEDAGRRARIDFLDEVRQKYSAAAVALAHHADDQAETVLMRLLRGSGMTGLSGMAHRNSRGYIRPLLDVSRSEIEKYLRGRGLGWREDASNSDTSYLRNRIRHELLPLLETYNPSIRSSLSSTASILGDDEALLAELAEQAFSGSCLVEEGRVVCGIDQLRSLKPSLRRRVLRHAFKMVTGNLEGVRLCHIEALSGMVASDRPNSRLSLPQQTTAVRAYGHLSFSHETVASPDAAYEVQIAEPGCYKLPGGGSMLVEWSDASAVPADSKTAMFISGKVPFPWLVRTFRPGDRMTPFGMSGRKKVKDIFIDRKIPLPERRRIPLLFCGGQLLWIAGVSVSELSRIDMPSAVMVRVTWHPCNCILSEQDRSVNAAGTPAEP